MSAPAEMRGLEVTLEALRAFDGPTHDLLIGDPCFEAPRVLLHAMERAVEEGNTRYASNQGTPHLRAAVCRLHERAGEMLGPERIFVTHGSKVGILALFGTLLEPGDEVVLPTPCYEPYESAARLFGAKVVGVPRRPPFFPYDVDLIGGAVRDRTRLVVLASPCNPTGAVLSREQAEALRELAELTGVKVVVDLAYERFRFGSGIRAGGAAGGGRSGGAGDGTHDGSDDEEADAAVTPEPTVDPEGEHLVRVYSFSKTFSVCGWRLGYVVGTEKLVAALTRFQSANLNPPNTLVQRALESCADVPDPFFREAREAVRERMIGLREVLNEVGLPAELPEGGFYLMADAEKALERLSLPDTRELARELAKAEGVGLCPGSDFGAEGWLRAAVVGLRGAGLEKDLEDVRERLARFLG